MRESTPEIPWDFKLASLLEGVKLPWGDQSKDDLKVVKPGTRSPKPEDWKPKIENRKPKTENRRPKLEGVSIPLDDSKGAGPS